MLLEVLEMSPSSDGNSPEDASFPESEVVPVKAEDLSQPPEIVVFVQEK
jgi:hypothetical protein